MAIAFRHIVFPPLNDFDATLPDGAIAGIIGEDRSGQRELLRLAAGLEEPISGVVEVGKSRRLLGPTDTLSLAPVDVLLLDHTLAVHDPLVRERALVALERLRRSGVTVLLVSHDEDLLRRIADEIWWVHGGKLTARGGPDEVLTGWRRHLSARIRSWGNTVAAPLHPSLRRGDGRAEIVHVDLFGEEGKPTTVWHSGELAVVRVTVRFHQAVEDPVVGMLIRTRIGLHVYGTNTELEKLKLGPRAAGDSITITYAFRCELCPEQYTLTIASHDPDGVWHDWQEDAVMFVVTDERYTAGVANLRATATVSVAGSQ